MSATRDDLSPKLQRRLQALQATGGIGPWDEACKQHEQLVRLGLAVRGECAGRAYVVLRSVAEAVEAEERDPTEPPVVLAPVRNAS